METKQIESFIRKFERHTFWENFRKGEATVMFQLISFVLALSFGGILILLTIAKRFEELNNFAATYLIIFGSYAFINTDFFKEETIEGINVPEFEKFLEDEEYEGMETDRKIIGEFLMNKEITEEVEEVTTEEAEEVMAAEIIN